MLGLAARSPQVCLLGRYCRTIDTVDQVHLGGACPVVRLAKSCFRRPYSKLRYTYILC